MLTITGIRNSPDGTAIHGLNTKISKASKVRNHNGEWLQNIQLEDNSAPEGKTAHIWATVTLPGNVPLVHEQRLYVIEGQMSSYKNDYGQQRSITVTRFSEETASEPGPQAKKEVDWDAKEDRQIRMHGNKIAAELVHAFAIANQKLPSLAQLKEQTCIIFVVSQQLVFPFIRKGISPNLLPTGSADDEPPPTDADIPF